MSHSDLHTVVRRRYELGILLHVLQTAYQTTQEMSEKVFVVYATHAVL